MPTNSSDRAKFLEATVAEIKSLRDMGTRDPDETLDESQIKTSQIGMSRCVFTKKYHPDCTFDKYKCRVLFQGDRCVMSETVQLLLSGVWTFKPPSYMAMYQTTSLFVCAGQRVWPMRICPQS